ncbi:MAG: glucose-6-phosphate dehydrogenase [Myxococcales bacterium]|nr:glucose-6-phosphate dehydrogenase [Myxococcales bacterium]
MSSFLPFSTGTRLPPCQIVIFGATGDLTARKLIPAVVDNARLQAFPMPVQVIGVARTAQDTETFRNQLQAWLNPEQRAVWAEFAPNIHYFSIGSGTPQDYADLKQELEDLAGPAAPECGRLFYLALAPALFAPTVEKLAAHSMLVDDQLRVDAWRRVVIEKPFGTDLGTAQWLNLTLRKYLREDQIYRIDHYLGKETVQNLLSFRFQNAIFEPLWNRQHIESVEISVCETLGMESGRAGYYDTSGALRDMVANHMLQLLCLTAMEAPGSLDADSVRGEKFKVLSALESFRDSQDVWDNVVRGQYVSTPNLKGYSEEQGVPPRSQTETYVAIRARIHNWRWNGVPFFLRTGKRLNRRFSEIVVHFRVPPVDLFSGPLAADVCRLRPNSLTLKIQPQEGMQLSFLVKQPGAKPIMRQATLGFDYKDLFAGDTTPAYQRLLLDATMGQATLFIRGDEAEAAWRFCDSVRAGWQDPEAPPPFTYPAGSDGPLQAADLFRGCEGTWSAGHE